jgi:glycosyltransferase involved in cell wall biosynthesis
MSPIKNLSVFFPAYNEEDNIANTVSQAIDVLKSLNLADYEVIVVDDGSSDRTAAAVQKLAAKNSKIRLIRHSYNRGYGAALKTGFSSAKFDWIAFTDSDGQFDFREISKFLTYVPDYQVIAGYRKNRSDSKFRRMMAFLLRIWDTILFGLNLKDVDCGFKLIKKSVIDKVFPLVTESAITETEMMAKIHRAGFPIKQIGVAPNRREF